MSNDVNQLLLERAAECIDYFQDKLPAKLIEIDMDRQDMEMLSYHVNAAEALMAQEELESGDVI